MTIWATNSKELLGEIESDGHIIQYLYIIQYLFIKIWNLIFSKNCKISQMQRSLEGYMCEREIERERETERISCWYHPLWLKNKKWTTKCDIGTNHCDVSII